MPKRRGTKTCTRYVLLQTHTAGEKSSTTCCSLWSHVLDTQQLPGGSSICWISFPSFSLLTIKFLIHPFSISPQPAVPRQHRAAHSPLQAEQLDHPARGTGIHKTIGAPHKFSSTGSMTSNCFVELAVMGTRCPHTPERNPRYYFPGVVT